MHSGLSQIRNLGAVLVAVLTLTGTSRAARAQSGGEPVMARVLTRRLERMFADTTVRRLSRATTPLELLEQTPLNQMGRLADSTLVKFYDVFARSLDQVSVPTCAQLWDPATGVSGGSFLTVAAAVDSTLSEEWVDVVEQEVWAELRHRQVGPTATAEEAQAAIQSARRGLPASDREVLVRAGRHDTLSEADRCTMVRAIFHGYNRIPLAQRARVLRRVAAP